MTREEIISKFPAQFARSPKKAMALSDNKKLYTHQEILAAMHEYGIQERNKAIDEAAALMYDDGRHPQAQPDVDRIMNLKNKTTTP